MERLVATFGGACLSCGYSKSVRALTFHHRDPSQKSFGLNARLIMSVSWEEAVAEASKCDLLCANCHMELEDSLSISKYADYFDEGGPGRI